MDQLGFIIVGIIGAAVVGGLVEWLLRQILPERPSRYGHLLAVILAIIVFAFFAALPSSSRSILFSGRKRGPLLP